MFRKQRHALALWLYPDNRSNGGATSIVTIFSARYGTLRYLILRILIGKWDLPKAQPGLQLYRINLNEVAKK